MHRLVPLLVLVGAAVGAQEDLGALRSRAASLVAAGKYAEAEPILTRVLGLRERESGAEDPAVLPAIAELAGLYRAEGRNGDAEKLYLRSIAIKTKTSGPDSLDLIPDLKQLGGLYVAMARLPDAERQ